MIREQLGAPPRLVGLNMRISFFFILLLQVFSFCFEQHVNAAGCYYLTYIPTVLKTMVTVDTWNWDSGMPAPVGVNYKNLGKLVIKPRAEDIKVYYYDLDTEQINLVYNSPGYSCESFGPGIANGNVPTAIDFSCYAKRKKNLGPPGQCQEW